MESLDEKSSYYYQKGIDDTKKIYEKKAKSYDELVKIVGNFYNDEDGDLCEIGEAVASYLKYI